VSCGSQKGFRRLQRGAFLGVVSILHVLSAVCEVSRRDGHRHELKHATKHALLAMQVVAGCIEGSSIQSSLNRTEEPKQVSFYFRQGNWAKFQPGFLFKRFLIRGPAEVQRKGNLLGSSFAFTSLLHSWYTASKISKSLQRAATNSA
jgi:hypothetical protein